MNYTLSQVTFSNEQNELINIFDEQIAYLQDTSRKILIIRVVVKGKAGSGKSALITSQYN